MWPDTNIRHVIPVSTMNDAKTLIQRRTICGRDGFKPRLMLK